MDSCHDRHSGQRLRPRLVLFKELNLLFVGLAIADLGFCFHYLLQEVMLAHSVFSNGNLTQPIHVTQSTLQEHHFPRWCVINGDHADGGSNRPIQLTVVSPDSSRKSVDHNFCVAIVDSMFDFRSSGYMGI